MALLGELSVRDPSYPAGGPLVDVHATGDAGALAGRGAAVLLIHGYNNSQAVAGNSFDLFVADLTAASGRGTLPWPVIGVQWPGDEPNRILSTLSYPVKIGVAQEAAQRIGRYLRGAFGPGGRPIILSVVAHSLGCRLTLELLVQLVAQPDDFNIVIDRVALMAAAVPLAHVAPDGDLRAAAELPKQTSVLYSTGDLVLHFAFPPGQTLGGDGFFPTAVGRFGGPPSTWLSSEAMASGGKQYDHSSYWPGTESAASIAALLGLAVPATTAARALPYAALPETNEIGARLIPARSTGSGTA